MGLEGPRHHKQDRERLLDSCQASLQNKEKWLLLELCTTLTDDGVDAETSPSLSLHLYLSSPPLHFFLTLTFGL